MPFDFTHFVPFVYEYCYFIYRFIRCALTLVRIHSFDDFYLSVLYVGNTAQYEQLHKKYIWTKVQIHTHKHIDSPRYGILIHETLNGTQKATYTNLNAHIQAYSCLSIQRVVDASHTYKSRRTHAHTCYSHHTEHVLVSPIPRLFYYQTQTQLTERKTWNRRRPKNC